MRITLHLEEEATKRVIEYLVEEGVQCYLTEPLLVEERDEPINEEYAQDCHYTVVGYNAYIPEGSIIELGWDGDSGEEITFDYVDAALSDYELALLDGVTIEVHENYDEDIRRILENK